MKQSYFLALLFSFYFSYSQNDSVVISQSSGSYEAFTLKASSSYGKLVYEVNGAEPNKSSKEWKDSLVVDKSKVISFGLKINDKVVYKQTCFYLINFKTTFPVMSISTHESNLYDPRIGIYTRGTRAYQDSTGYWKNANYNKKWERKSRIIYLDLNGEEVVNQNAGLRIFGGMTRSASEKSLRIIARQTYGEARFNYPFFKYRSNKKYKHLILRNSGNDAYKTRFKDVLSTQLSKNLDIDIQEFQPVNLFINGVFRGVYNLRERIGQHYLKYNFNADIETLNLLQGRFTEDHGSNKSYKELREFLFKSNLTNEDNIDSLNKKIDVKNFLDYNIAQIYLCNVDYRGNIRFWQPDDDGVFRWVMYDTDLGFGGSRGASYNFLRDRLSTDKIVWHNPQWSTLLLRKILENKKLKHQFVNQICYSLATVFEPDNVNRMIDSVKTVYKPELMRHFNLIRGDSLNWEKNIEKMKAFSKIRPKHLLKHTQNQFNLGDNFYLDIEIDSSKNGVVRINQNKISSGKFAGNFFKNIPIPIEIKPHPLYKIFISTTENSNTLRLSEKSENLNDNLWIRSLKDTLQNRSVDSLKVNIKFDYIGDSPWKNKVKINEIGGLGENIDDKWVELISIEKAQINLDNWKLVSLSEKALLSKANFKDVHLTKLPDSLLSKTQKESLYLLDSEDKLVDSVSWINDFSKNKFFIERPLPNNKFFVILEGLGTPNSFNPLHIKTIDIAYNEALRAKFTMCFFALLLALAVRIKTY